MKQEWVSSHFRTSAVYGSGGIDSDVFRAPLKLGNQCEK